VTDHLTLFLGNRAAHPAGQGAARDPRQRVPEGEDMLKSTPIGGLPRLRARGLLVGPADGGDSASHSNFHVTIVPSAAACLMALLALMQAAAETAWVDELFDARPGTSARPERSL
jgi:hypothetical protein